MKLMIYLASIIVIIYSQKKENKFKTEYEVKGGDALNSIAKRSGTTPEPYSLK